MKFADFFEQKVHKSAHFAVIISGVVEMIEAALAALDTEERRNELAEFYAQHKNALYAFALSRTHNREQAEDAVQEAFLRIAKYPERFFALPVHKRMSYAVIVTGNVIRDMLSGNAKRAELPDDDFNNIADDALSVEDRVIGEIAEKELNAFIKAMPEAQREAVILKIVHGMTTAEIAAALNISEPTARKRVSNAYRTIEKYLNEG